MKLYIHTPDGREYIAEIEDFSVDQQLFSGVGNRAVGFAEQSVTIATSTPLHRVSNEDTDK